MASEYGEFCREQRERKRAAQQKRWERNYAQLAKLPDTHGHETPPVQVLVLGDGTHWRVLAYGLTVDYYPTTGTYYELHGTIRGQRDHLHALLVYMKRESVSRAHQQRAREQKYGTGA
jgi:hypothetical protein